MNSSQIIKMEEETSVSVCEGTEQIIIDFGDICRFCLSETKNNVSIYDKCSSDCMKENDESTIFDIVSKVTSIKLNNVDGFPSLVCENCFNIVKMCLDFQQSCLLSDRYLKDCYIKTLEETKAKISLNAISVKDETGEQNTSDFMDNQILQKNNIEVKPEIGETDNRECDGNVEQYASMRNIYPDDNEFNENLRMKSKRKPGLYKKGMLSILKAGNIKQKYQRMNSLSERLKDAQSKLVEDILRTKDIMSASIKIEEQTNELKDKVSCPQCLMTFATPDLLTYHFITSHVTNRKSQGTINVFECKICRKEFSFMYQLMRHYKSMHKVPVSKLSREHLAPKHKQNAEPEKSYQCLDCLPSKVFNKRKNLLQHLTHHAKLEDTLTRSLVSDHSLPEKLYKCMRCDVKQTFSTRFSLNRHLINVHNLKWDEVTGESATAVSGSSMPEEQESPLRNSIDEGDSVKLKLVKIHVCLDCSPPTSFTDVTDFIQHKVVCHQKKLESMSLKELTPVYVESVNVFEKTIDDTGQTFKVICKSCDMPSEFFSASDFVQHMKVHHDDVPKEKWEVETKYLLDSFAALKRRDRMWKCTECPASYMRKHSLRYHLKEKHNKVRRLGAVKCPEPDCDASFFTNRQVIQHGITVHEKYYADIHKVFKDKILDGPGETDKRVRNFECDICQKKYLGKTSLKRHILRAHLGKSDIENAVCSYCGKTFSNNLNLKSHIDFVHEALFVSCPICKKNINFKTIGKHYKIHQASTEFQPGAKNRYLCNQCGRVLKSKSGFDGHQKLHLNVRDQICDICGSGFTTKKNLYIHKRGHDATHKKVFECDQCDKVFSGKHTLNRHLLTHSGEKNFVCEMCSKSFYTLQELNRHTRYHKKEYRFSCQMCDMRFLDRSRFRHHMMRHRNIRPHKCHFCDKVFIIRQKMNLHMAARHNVEVQSTKAIWKDPKTYIPLDDLL